MNYRHHYHAGNFADVMKHAVLVQLVRALQRKDKGFLYLDTHAGRGGYDLLAARRGDTLARTPEHPGGIGRLLSEWHGQPARDSATREPVLMSKFQNHRLAARATTSQPSFPYAGETNIPPALADYLRLVRDFDRRSGNLDPNAIRYYPGSPCLVRALMRPQDRMALCELHPAEFQSLRDEFQNRASTLLSTDEKPWRARLRDSDWERRLPAGRRRAASPESTKPAGKMPALPVAVASFDEPFKTTENPKQTDASGNSTPAVSIHEMDGYTALRAMLPAQEKRALVLIDPPYEARDEYEKITRSLRDALRRMNAATYAVWYPLTERARADEFLDRLAMLNPPPTLAVELTIAGESTALKMRGCGLAVINPPWQIDQTLPPLLAALSRRLAQAPGAKSTLAWLVRE